VFKSFPDNSESELVYEENTWIDLSLEGISSLIVTGTCSVTVRDEDENVLATYTEGTYICCGAAADQTRFPNAQGLTWNDKIRSVYLYSTNCGDGDVWLEEFEGHTYPHMYYEGAWYPVIGNWFWNNQYGYDRICKNLGYSSGTRGSESQKLPAKSDGSKGDGIFLGACKEGVTDLLSECGNSDQISPEIKHAPNKSWAAIDCSGTSNIAPKSCVPTTTLQPTAEPTKTPTLQPTAEPTTTPTLEPTLAPTMALCQNIDGEFAYGDAQRYQRGWALSNSVGDADACDSLCQQQPECDKGANVCKSRAYPEDNRCYCEFCEDDCTVEVFKSFPDNSESELVYEENTWIDLSLEGISSLIVTGTCSVTVRDEDENVLATYTEGTYICCGAAADQTRFPNAQGLTWNDKIRSVYLYSTLGVESTEDWNFVNEDSTSYSVSLFSADERELLKSGDFEMQCDLSFRLQRDDSKSYSTFTYLDLETKTVHTQKMRGGYQNHQRFEMPSCTQITCHHHEKSASCPWTSKNAILLAVDFRPRSGSAYRKQWNRNRFTFTGTHYYATPTTENRRRLQAGSSLERLMKRFI